MPYYSDSNHRLFPNGIILDQPQGPPIIGLVSIMTGTIKRYIAEVWYI